ncbi:hypothetical protein GSI_00799 [Ganoderma sinense ZZ0214-1]|uniref:BTB domain-containing protein n=1 Tax=Ganoderma sinense ZZ0214-1 TaxID=1077348 RepID=A0A2G8STK7_9APHY|nr:hypothetical protein GSI_00799 [Ganoderma sinense ZZ0214-1]
MSTAASSASQAQPPSRSLELSPSPDSQVAYSTQQVVALQSVLRETCATSKMHKHDNYYFDDGNIVFEVEGILYRLHRSILERHSPVFRELFMVPLPDGSNEGMSDWNPVVLEGIDPKGFTRLISLLYPQTLGDCNVATADEWMSIFDQAERWQMGYLRECALNQLRTTYISPIPKIVFWMRYHLPKTEIIPSLIDLITRPDSLSLSEAYELGLEMLVKLAHARDIARDNGLCPRSTGFSVKRDEALARIVHKVFFSQESTFHTLTPC